MEASRLNHCPSTLGSHLASFILSTDSERFSNSAERAEMDDFTCCYFNLRAAHFCRNSENQTELGLVFLAYFSYLIAVAFLLDLISRLDF